LRVFWALLPVALALNLGLGKLAIVLRLPLYLDMTGTVLVGALCGPGAGALTGGLTTVVMTLTGDLYTALFVGTGLAVGALAGLLARAGLFGRPGLAALAGLFAGFVAALLSAPVSAYLRGGVTGAGTDLVVAAFRAAGRSTVEACFLQSLLSDPLDKLVTFVLVQTLLARVPARLLTLFPAGARLGSLRAWTPGYRTGGRSRWRAPGEAPAGSGLFVAGQGWLHRLAPSTKLLALGLCLVGTVLAAGPREGWLGPALPLAAAALYGLGLTAGVGFSLTRLLAVLWLPAAVTLLALEGWLGPDPRLEIGLSAPGLLGAVTLALRLAVGLQALALVLLTTRPDHLGAQLERWRVPSVLTFAVLNALQLVPALQRRLHEVQRAQAARGFDAGAQGWRALPALLGPLLAGLLENVHERSLALEARGLGAGRRTRLEPLPGTRWDLGLNLALLALGVLCLSWR